MKTKLTLFIAVLVAALFGLGCESTSKGGGTDNDTAASQFTGIYKVEAPNASAEQRMILYEDGTYEEVSNLSNAPNSRTTWRLINGKVHLEATFTVVPTGEDGSTHLILRPEGNKLVAEKIEMTPLNPNIPIEEINKEINKTYFTRIGPAPERKNPISKPINTPDTVVLWDPKKFSGGNKLPKDINSLKALAEQGNPIAQTELGTLYYSGGSGLKQDYKEAMKWFRKAAALGFPNAQHNIGYMYLKGHGVKMDYEETMKWTRRAADQGLSISQNFLGTMYFKGWGVPKNYILGYAWWEVAASNNEIKKSRVGANSADENLGKAKKLITASQITKAKELANEMVKKNPRLIQKNN